MWKIVKCMHNVSYTTFSSHLVSTALLLFCPFEVESFVNDYYPGSMLSINSSLTSWAASLCAHSIHTAIIKRSRSLTSQIIVGGHRYYPARGKLAFGITSALGLSLFELLRLSSSLIDSRIIYSQGLAL
jgi:hypothetical protein